MQVRLVTWDDEPPVGGQGVYMRELREALTERGIDVSTCAGRGRFEISYPRVTGRGHLDMSLALNRSTSPILETHPDVVHLSGGPGGIQLLRRLPVPSVYSAYHTHHQSTGWRHVRRLFERLELRSYQLADRVAAISTSTAQAVVEMGIDSSKVEVISPGIHAPEPPLEEGSREQGRILFVGRLEPEKGPLDAVAAMSAIVREDPGARGYVVGSGSLAPEVADAAASTGGRVKFLGFLREEDVFAQYRSAQVVLVPSSYEGLGLVALEAMAHGAVAVGYDVDGLRDAIGTLGLLVPRGDVRGLVDASLTLFREHAYRRDLAHRASEVVRLERSWARCAERFEELYGELV